MNPVEKWCQTQGPGDASGPAKTDLARWMTLENVKQPMSRKIALASVTVNHPVYRQQENSQ